MKRCLISLLCTLMCSGACQATVNKKSDKVFWQAHRGGGAHDAPDNTLAAMQATWKLGGIPEADIRTTRDGVMICLHDNTPARTTTAPPELASLTVVELDFAQIRQWDAGVRFSPEYQGEKVPALLEVFNAMLADPQRELYMDIKEVDLIKLGRMIDSLGLGRQILVASSRQSECKTLKAAAHGVRSMLWIGGTAQEIEEKFIRAGQTGFDGLDQVQLHLNDAAEIKNWRYQLSFAVLKKALQQCRQAGIDLEVFVYQFAESDIHTLLDLGIRWYATDEPKRFAAAVAGWRK
jgi:glycerophosphoryl diester phosphodiesterase